MLEKILPIVVSCFILSGIATAGNVTSNGVINRVRTFLLASTLSVCVACGPLSDTSFLHRQRLADARRASTRVLDLQKTSDTLTGHVLAQDHNGRYVIGKIIEQGDQITIHPYQQDRLIIVEQQEIFGQLIDNHQHVGLEVTLPSEEVGIEYLVGQVFAVYEATYDGNIYAITLSHKLDYSGDTHRLKYEDGNVLRFVHRRNLVVR